MPARDPPGAWSAAAIRELAMGFQASRVLLTAVDLDVFTAIGREPRMAGDVARAVGADERATDRLLDAVCALGLLEKRGGRFANVPAGLRFLVRDSPDYLAGLGHSSSMWRTWQGLTDSVRSGRPVIDAAINDRGDEWLQPFIAAMHHRARLQADDIIGRLGPSAARMLDVGGGSGAFAMAFARSRDDRSAVVFDLPNVLPLTRGYLDAGGMAARVATVAGDYTVDELPGGCDLVFMSAVVHSNPPGVNQALLQRAARAVAPGGEVAVADWIMDEDRVSPAAGAMFALNMLVAAEGGDTYTEGTIRGWMAAARLTVVARHDTPFGTGIIVGRK